MRIPQQDGSVELVRENTEVWTMRSVIAGIYKTSVHLYRCDSTKIPAQGIAVEMKIQKINPYSIVMVGTLVLHKTWDEALGYKFTVAPDGSYSNVMKNDEALVDQVIHRN